MPGAGVIVLGAGAGEVDVGADAQAATTTVNAQSVAVRIPEIETIIENPIKEVREDSVSRRRAACRAFVGPVDSDSTTAHNLHWRWTSRFASPKDKWLPQETRSAPAPCRKW